MAHMFGACHTMESNMQQLLKDIPTNLIAESMSSVRKEQ